MLTAMLQVIAVADPESPESTTSLGWTVIGQLSEFLKPEDKEEMAEAVRMILKRRMDTIRQSQ